MDVGEVESVGDLLLASASFERREGEEVGATSVSFSPSTMSDLLCLWFSPPAIDC